MGTYEARPLHHSNSTKVQKHLWRPRSPPVHLRARCQLLQAFRGCQADAGGGGVGNPQVGVIRKSFALAGQDKRVVGAPDFEAWGQGVDGLEGRKVYTVPTERAVGRALKDAVGACHGVVKPCGKVTVGAARSREVKGEAFCITVETRGDTVGGAHKEAHHPKDGEM